MGTLPIGTLVSYDGFRLAVLGKVVAGPATGPFSATMRPDLTWVRVTSRTDPLFPVGTLTSEWSRSTKLSVRPRRAGAATTGKV